VATPLQNGKSCKIRIIRNHLSSYRDSFRQFLKFVQQRLRKPPSRLTFEEIDAPLIDKTEKTMSGD
jgi:hypothetical protein